MDYLNLLQKIIDNVWEEEKSPEGFPGFKFY